MKELRYLAGYPEKILKQVKEVIAQEKLGELILKKYPLTHQVKSNKALYSYTNEIKSEFLRKSQPLSKVIYDDKIDLAHDALGLHTFASRVQGVKLKSKHEIRVSSIFKNAPAEFLKMIVVHELGHLKEKEHNKAFYKLCVHMEPDYHQFEFDLRLYLIQLDLFGKLY